jgi:hypothetical protein
MVGRIDDREPAGQVLILVALLLTILLAFAGLTIDVGRQLAERRHVQNAADAAALAACRGLTQGESNSAAAADARRTALINIEGSPSAGRATIAADTARVYTDGHAGDPAYLESGILISSGVVRVAIKSSVDATVGRVVGVSELETNARARCGFEGGPAIPLAARRYINAPGPGNGFIDTAATAATATTGQVDTASVTGYDARTPASESQPGPEFELYGPDSKAANDSAFRGFVALDVRNFESDTSRVYYNGVTSQSSENILKDKEGDYLITGYVGGPGFPAVVTPPDPNDQVAALEGNDTPMVVGNFSTSYAVGDRLLLAMYNGTVQQIPDFAIAPPSAFVVPTTTILPITGPNFVVSRNDAFDSTVTLHLHGDHAASNPAWDLIPVDPPSTAPPTPGHMNTPTWTPDVFIPTKQGTKVTSSNIRTSLIPAGIYTVWLEGHSGDPYFQSRRYPVPVKVGGATRDFSFGTSTTSATASSMGASVSLPIYVSTASSGLSAWGGSGSAVALSVDATSFTDCSYGAAAIGAGQITLSSSSVTPSSSGQGTLSTLTASTVGLATGCYKFNVRGTGTNGSGQRVVHIQPITIYVATTASSGTYVEIIGFAVFQVTYLDSNSIRVKAVSGVTASADDNSLLRAERARLMPW